MADIDPFDMEPDDPEAPWTVNPSSRRATVPTGVKGLFEVKRAIARW